MVLVESTKKMRCSAKDKKRKQGKFHEGATEWLGYGATVEGKFKGDRPRAKWVFVDALFPRTFEIWWLVLGCTRAPRELNPRDGRAEAHSTSKPTASGMQTRGGYVVRPEARARAPSSAPKPNAMLGVDIHKVPI